MLNPSQQRYLTAVLTEVEKHVANAEIAASSGAAFSAEEREELQHFLAQMRAVLQTLANKFVQLAAPGAIAPRWQVHTLLEFALVEFLKLTAGKLRSYGELDVEDFAKLMARLTPLKSDLETLLRKY